MEHLQILIQRNPIRLAHYIIIALLQDHVEQLLAMFRGHLLLILEQKLQAR